MILHYVTKKKDSYAGFSLTEAAIVLGVVGAVLGGLWSVVGTVRESSQQARMVSQSVITVQRIRDVYRGAAQTGSGNLTSFLIGQNAITSDMVRRRTTPFTAAHFWDTSAGGGSLVIRGAGDPTSLFVFELNRLPVKACVGLASQLTGKGGPTGLVSSRINSHSVITGTISPDTAVVQCNNNSTNVISLTYRLR